MKKLIKRLLLVIVAAIVIISYLKDWTPGEQGTAQNAAGSQAVLQIVDDAGQEAPEAPTPAEEPETEDLDAAPAEEPESEEQETATAEESQPEENPAEEPVPEEAPASAAIDEDGVYTSKEDVALYIYTYGKLPSNFITKKEAEAAGWPGGNLEPYCPGKCIGGSYFGNNEGLLPKKKGRTWTECDIDTLGAKSRGAKRIVFSNDGLIYYTGDHYESFELLYGEP